MKDFRLIPLPCKGARHSVKVAPDGGISLRFGPAGSHRLTRKDARELVRCLDLALRISAAYAPRKGNRSNR